MLPSDAAVFSEAAVTSPTASYSVSRRVPTHLENLENSWNIVNLENSWNFMLDLEFLV